MKKIFTFLLFIGVMNLAVGQTFQDSHQRPATSSLGVLDISGGIESSGLYTSGSTVDLNFILTIESPDLEYADSITMTFPEGMTPTGGTDPMPGAGSGDLEALNPIDGQVISWGDNDNSWGGNGPGVFEFFVTVDIDASVSGDQEIAFHVSGDEYAGSVHEFSGTVIVKEATAPDLITTITTPFISEYYKLPLSQATMEPTSSVKNVGLVLEENVQLELLVTGGFAYTEDLPNPLAPGATSLDTFPVFTATAVGMHHFKFTADFEDDINYDDNIAEDSVDVTLSEMARDNGEVDSYIGVGTPNTELGNIFTITVQDTVTSLKFALNPEGDNAGDVVSAKVRAFTGGAPGDVLGSSVEVTVVEGTDIYEVTFIPAVVLAPGEYYIGLVEGANNVQLAYTTTSPYVSGTAWAYFSDTWNNLGELGFEHTYYLRPMFNDVIPVNNDIQLTSVSPNGIVAIGDVNISGTVKNLSTTAPLTSFDVVYAADGTTSAVYSVTGISVPMGGDYDFTHNVPYALAAGSHTVEVTVSNPNGETDENPDDNSKSTELMSINEVFPKAVVGEEATGTWCGWCVRGHVGLKDMAHNHDDGSWIGIAVHNGDPMANTEYDGAIGSFISGYPSGVINRMNGEVDPGEFESAYQTEIAKVPLAKVEIPETPLMNPATREVSVDVSTIFALDMTNANAKLSMIVLEDSITGTASGYAQANYYSSNSIAIVDWEGIDWSTLGNPIPADQMVYDHVGRYIVGGFAGVAGSVPASVTYNEASNYTFSTTIPEGYNANHISFVVLLLDSESGEVINAVQKHMDIAVGNVTIGDATSVQLSPNPTNGLLTIDGEAGSTITVYDALGRLVLSDKMSTAKHILDLSSFENGSYWVEVFNNNTIVSKKVVLTK